MHKRLYKNKGDEFLKKAKAWVHKKLNSGVPLQELRRCVGVFSNRSKKKVMKEKGLSDKQYKRRYDFLFNAYIYLESL